MFVLNSKKKKFSLLFDRKWHLMLIACEHSNAQMSAQNGWLKMLSTLIDENRNNNAIALLMDSLRVHK